MSPRINSCSKLYQGRVFQLFRENVTLDNGVTVDMDIIRHPGASAMVPVKSGRRIILLKQYRHALGDFIWEIPAGTLDADETPLECAKRELAEETGFSADEWQEMGVITPLPGYTDERIHVFLATKLIPTAQNLDKDEMLSIHELRLGKAIEMIHQGEIQDGKTIAGLFMAAHQLGF